MRKQKKEFEEWNTVEEWVTCQTVRKLFPPAKKKHTTSQLPIESSTLNLIWLKKKNVASIHCLKDHMEWACDRFNAQRLARRAGSSGRAPYPIWHKERAWGRPQITPTDQKNSDCYTWASRGEPTRHYQSSSYSMPKIYESTRFALHAKFEHR